MILFFSEDIINIVYEYFCKQKTVRPYLDHGKQYINLSDQDVNTNLTKFMPNISILGDKIIWEGEGEVDFYRIKESYKENFNNYQEIEQYQLKWIRWVKNSNGVS